VWWPIGCVLGSGERWSCAQPQVVADSTPVGEGGWATGRAQCNARPGALHKPCRVCRTKHCNRRPPPTSMHPPMRAPPLSGRAPTPTMSASPSSTRLYSLSTTQIHTPILSLSLFALTLKIRHLCSPILCPGCGIPGCKGYHSVPLSTAVRSEDSLQFS
jgi:hypothetical protein